ncbi:hypothetical protein Taro_009997, partial [Colocasia esculenta]|nr:hypothetical protein [Colocasia esculenta]
WWRGSGRGRRRRRSWSHKRRRNKRIWGHNSSYYGSSILTSPVSDSTGLDGPDFSIDGPGGPDSSTVGPGGWITSSSNGPDGPDSSTPTGLYGPTTDCHNMDYKLTSSHFGFTFLHNFKFAYFTLYTCTFTHCSHTHLYIHIYTFTFSAVTHSPNHQRRTQHITSHIRHLGNTMATLGLRRPGEQVSTLTSGTCPPPGFPPNALRTKTIVIQRLDVPSTQDPWFNDLRATLEEKARKRGAQQVMLTELEEILDEEQLPWYFEIEQYCKDGTYPEGASTEDRRAIRRAALRYTVVGEVLYKRALNGVLLRCLTDNEAWKVVEGAHASECGGHVNSQMLAKKIIRQGYYWPTLEEDCTIYVRRCVKCQLHADKIHAPSSSLHPLSTPWPFFMWAFDIVGPLGDPNAQTKQKSFILTATEYYTKWAEAEAFTEIKASTLCRFIMRNIISQFGVPSSIVTDNGPQFISQELQD